MATIYECDHCDKMISGVVRFHCEECKDYDLCADCIPKAINIHNTRHTFKPITRKSNKSITRKYQTPRIPSYPNSTRKPRPLK